MASSISPIRLTGLSSGLDTDAIVKSLLTSAQTRVDKQAQTTAKLQWKADALREINSMIRSFRETNLSVLNPTSNMLSKTAYSMFSVSMLTSSAAVSVSAGSAANPGKMTIDSITQLASAATVKSTGAFAGTTMNTSTTLADLELSIPLEFDDGEISFSINGETFTFEQSATLSDVISSVNASDAGVRMSYSSLTKGFTIAAKTTGSSSKVEIENLKGNAFAAEDAAFGIAEGAVFGQDAILSIEGVEVVQSSNSFTIDGLTYSLKDTSSSAVSFSVDQNIDGTVNKIKTFIESYNSLIDTLQKKIGETTYRSYTPLTTAQKAEMSESEISLWEDKSKSGLLRNDASIASLLSTMRSAFYTAVESTGISASAIGLSTGSYYDGGKITVDTDKLRSALENNPDAVSSLFTNKSTSTDKKQAFAESGLITRISDALLSYTSSATNNTLAGLELQISNSKNNETSLLSKLTVKESSLWARFTAMESALSKMNSQSSWLTSLFSSNSN